MSALEHDDSVLSPRANRTIWIYFLVFIVVLYVTIEGLISYFRYEVEVEKYEKIGSVTSLELNQLRSFEDQVLRGEASLIDGKKSISIDEATNQIIERNFKPTLE